MNDKDVRLPRNVGILDERSQKLHRCEDVKIRDLDADRPVVMRTQTNKYPYKATPANCTILLHIILQLKYHNTNRFRPTSGHLQGLLINHMYETYALCKKIRLKLGFDVVRYFVDIFLHNC